jgi:hypothetical protein
VGPVIVGPVIVGPVIVGPVIVGPVIVGPVRSCTEMAYEGTGTSREPQPTSAEIHHTPPVRG